MGEARRVRCAEQTRRGPQPEGSRPGTVWAYNDVRVNLLCLALTLLWQRPLDSVLRDELLTPMGASATWSWHGYTDSFVEAGELCLPVVSGGAHWGDGLWMSARDLALLGSLYLDGGTWRGQPLLSREWIDLTWQPSPANPDYGLLWWLNTRQRVFPTAPASGRCARGNLGRHLLWLDSARRLVVSHWGDDVGDLLAAVASAVSATY